MNQIQVTPQNIHAVLASMGQHLDAIKDRQNSLENAMQSLEEESLQGLIDAAKTVLNHFLQLTKLEYAAIQQQREELEQVRMRVDSGIIIPK